MQEIVWTADVSADARLLAAVAFAAEQLFRDTGWKERVDEVLARLGEAMQASRVYLAAELPRESESALLIAPLASGFLILEDRAGRAWTEAERNAVAAVARIAGATMEVRSAHELYALVAKATNDVIWDWDPVAGTIVWNDALRTMFGYDPEAIDNRLQWWDQHIHPQDRGRVVSAINQAIESGATSWSDEYRFERADGSYTEVFDRCYISRGPDGQPMRMIGAMLDVTERKRAERIAAFMAEASAVLTSSLDYEATLKRVAALAVPVLADGCVFELGGESTAHVHTEHTIAVSLGDQPLGTLTLTMNESRRVFTEKDRYIAEDLARRAAMAIEHARLYEEAQQANRAKDQFLATLSHELRTPLTAILGWSKLLADTELEPDIRRLALDTIQKSAQAQARLVDDVLDMSRVISGKMRLQVQPVAVEEIVRGSVDAVRLAAKTKSIELVVPATRAGIVMGDPDRLQQVVWNLLTNAIKFTAAGGCVECGVETTADKVRLVVSDTGIGIAPEFLPHVFEPFRQAEGAAIRPQGGLGLGLAIVRYITEAHGGTVSAFSDGLGRGARFVVELPKISVTTDSPR